MAPKGTSVYNRLGRVMKSIPTVEPEIPSLTPGTEKMMVYMMIQAQMATKVSRKTTIVALRLMESSRFM
jgi:hypothetical protein